MRKDGSKRIITSLTERRKLIYIAISLTGQLNKQSLKPSTDQIQLTLTLTEDGYRMGCQKVRHCLDGHISTDPLKTLLC